MNYLKALFLVLVLGLYVLAMSPFLAYTLSKEGYGPFVKRLLNE